MENWKKLKEHSNYSISSEGNLRNDTTGYILKKLYNHRTGYQHYCIWIDGKQRTFYIHHLVAKTFIDNIDDLPEIDHIDRNRHNNSVNNLRWCSIKLNRNNRNKSKEYKEYNRIFTYKHTIIKTTFDGKIICIYSDIEEASNVEKIEVSTLRSRISNILDKYFSTYNKELKLFTIYSPKGKVIFTGNLSESKKFIKRRRINLILSYKNRNRMFFRDRFSYGKKVKVKIEKHL